MVAHQIKNKADADKRKRIGRQGEVRAKEILRLEGFTEIRDSENSITPYDLRALSPEGEPCRIEVKTRSPEAKTQFFTVRDSKLRNLSKIIDAGEVKEVYFVCINKYGYTIFTLGQIINEKIPNIKILKYKDSKTRSAIRDEKKWFKKDSEVYVRCSKMLRIKFRLFVVKHEFKNYGEALEELLRLAETHPNLVHEKGIRVL